MQTTLPLSTRGAMGAPLVTHNQSKRIRRWSAAWKTGLLGLVAAGTTLTARAQFPVNEAFTGITANNFVLGGSAVLTGTAGTPGYLRLTNNTGNQAGYAILKNSFPAPSGFSVSFEFFSYGGTGADGISVFLVDANGTDPTTAPSQFVVGAYGGSLGYAQKTKASGAVTADIPGATKGYLGIGLDEYGNFATSNEGRVGGYLTTATDGTTNTTTLVPQSVTLRGPGTGTSNYQYLTSSGKLPFNLSVATAEAQSTSADYRKAFIYVIPQADGTYKVTVRIQNGPNAVATTTSNFSIVRPPDNLRVGFAGSTGGLNNYHEIRNLSIVQPPIAVDDASATPYNKPVSISVLSNDKLIGINPAPLVPTKVDLDPSTITIDKSYTVAGQGTFSVDNSGNVTFTPSGTFSGTVSIPYTVTDNADAVSNPAQIVVVVTGADVETAVSGPTSVNPGTTSTYTVTTTDNGVEDAISVSPTLMLPNGFTYVSGGANYNPTTRVVTFSPSTLKAGQSVNNTVSITAPTATGTGNTFTSNYVYSNTTFIPDVVSTNNSSTLAVNVVGSANIAGVCSIPGRDGPVTLAAGTTPNTYYAGIGTASATNSTLTVNTTPTPTGATAIAAGDLLLIMQMQGATMDKSNTTAYGTITTSTTTAGKYEYAVATSAVSNAGNITLARPLTNSYVTNTTGSTFQVIRIPQYSSLTITGAITGPAWDGSVGGILALEVAGTTTFSGGSLNMNGKGFRGGAGRLNTSNGTNSTYAIATTDIPNNASAYASKGEGIAGTPFQVFTGGTTAVSGGTNTYDNYAGGSLSLGQPATGGGGANSTTVTQGQKTNNYFGGGGGGANGNAGATGQGDGANNNVTTALGGDGGKASPTPSANQFYLGGGGGAGTTSSTTAFLASSGGTGGGIILFRSGTVAGTAAISANGTSATNVTAAGVAGGGGGAGGTVVLLANSGLNGLTVTANGGDGGTSTTNGNGGGGSGGVLISNGTTSGTPSLTAGANGTGAAAGSSITATVIGGNCAPSLTTTLVTTKPNVVRSNSMQTNYVYTVSNTGGGVMGLTATPNLGAVGGTGLFTYTNTNSTTSAVIQYTDGTSYTLTASDYSVTGAGTSTPTFTLTPTFVVPSGASVLFSFVANISNSAQTTTSSNTYAYGSNAAASYSNPQRTTATATATATPYTSNGTTSADVVTIVVPLPVELTSFNVLAVRQDALLTWATASEQNNDHFVVERSVSGTDFVAVGTVRGQGNSARTNSYTFIDAGAGRLASGTVYYRLRPVALDGSSTYSPVRTVKFASALKSAATLYPNPSQGQITLDLSGLASGTYAVRVLDLTGRVLRTQQMNAEASPLDLTGLPQGAYLVLIQGNDVKQTLPLLRN